MNKPDSVVKKHFNFIADFVDFLIQKNIQIVEYRYYGYAFGSWYFDIAYKGQFRRFIYDGRDSLEGDSPQNVVNNLVTQQAAMMGYNDISMFLMFTFFICVPFILMIPAPKKHFDATMAVEM